MSLNICPEVRRRLPFSFSFAYGVHIVRARCNRVEYRANGIALGTRLNSMIRRRTACVKEGTRFRDYFRLNIKFSTRFSFSSSRVWDWDWSIGVSFSSEVDKIIEVICL